jgi:hypothetical protein
MCSCHGVLAALPQTHKPMNPTNHGLKLQKAWAKVNLSLYKLIISNIC